MRDEYQKLLKTKIKVEDSYFIRIIKSSLEGIFFLFYYLLKNPLENFWFECISISIQYSDMFLYLADRTVSTYIINYIFSLNLFGNKHILLKK